MTESKLTDAELAEIRERIENVCGGIEHTDSEGISDRDKLVQDSQKLLYAFERLQKERDDLKERFDLANSLRKKAKKECNEWRAEAEKDFRAGYWYKVATDWKNVAEKQEKVAIDSSKECDEWKRRYNNFSLTYGIVSATEFNEWKAKAARLEKENKSLKEKAYRNTLSKLSDSDFGRIL